MDHARKHHAIIITPRTHTYPGRLRAYYIVQNMHIWTIWDMIWDSFEPTEDPARGELQVDDAGMAQALGHRLRALGVCGVGCVRTWGLDATWCWLRSGKQQKNQPRPEP